MFFVVVNWSSKIYPKASNFWTPIVATVSHNFLNPWLTQVKGKKMNYDMSRLNYALDSYSQPKI